VEVPQVHVSEQEFEGMDEDVWNSTSNDAHHDRKLKERQWTLAIEEGHISNAYFKSLAPNPTTCVHPSCNEWATVACAVCTNSGTPSIVSSLIICSWKMVRGTCTSISRGKLSGTCSSPHKPLQLSVRTC